MNKTLFRILVYYFVFLSISGLLFVILRNKWNNFDSQYIDILTTPSAPYIVDNPCEKQFAADPTHHEWIKLRIECLNGEYAVSTFDARVFEAPITIRAVLGLGGIMNRYTVRFENDEVVELGKLKTNEATMWICDTNSGRNVVTENLDEPLPEIPITITCSYKNIYESK